MKKIIDHGNGITQEHTDGGFEIWRKNGEIHRDNDLPATISDYQEEWYQNGLQHRDNDRPAVITKDNDRVWKQNGKNHRIGKPAIIRGDNSQEWYEKGNLHRIDGPAIVNSDGTEEWWFNGEEMDKSQIDAVILKNKLSNELSNKKDTGSKGKGKI